MRRKTSRHNADYRPTGPAAMAESRHAVQSLVVEARAAFTDVRSLQSGTLSAAARRAIRDNDDRRFSRRS